MSMKKFTAILLLVALMIPMLATTSLAASWPSLSSSKYCEFTADSDINVYRNSSCTKRGTSSPSKSYDAYICRDDVCRILEISSKYVKLQYTTSLNKRPSMVYFTECNADGNGKYNQGSDCILQRMTYDEFVATKKPAGYIIAR